jgi:C-terminal processing protease CtpA/Prc
MPLFRRLRIAAVAVAAGLAAAPVAEAQAEPGFVGMHIQGMSPLLADALGLDTDEGVLVRDIALGGPAADAGFRRGDLILSFDGEHVDSFETLVRLVQKTEPGGRYPVTVMRLGESVDLTLEAGAWTPAWRVSKTAVGVLPEHGLTLAALTKKLRDGFGIRWGMTGVVVTLIDEKHASKVDLQRGELIVQVNQRPVWTPDQVLNAFRDAKAAGRKSVMMLIDGIGGFRFIYLTTKAAD